jgi:hypothetical protein
MIHGLGVRNKGKFMREMVLNIPRRFDPRHLYMHDEATGEGFRRSSP